MSLPIAPASPPPPAQVRVGSLVAAFGATAAWLTIGLLVLATFVPAAVNDSSSTFASLAGAAFFASVALWIVMVLEFFREKPSRPLVWGFLLLTGPVVGPLLFYYLVWRKRYAAYAVA